MASDRVPANEAQRMAALRSYLIGDRPPEPEYDRVTALAARLFDVPIALVVLIDADRQRFKSHHGLPIAQTSRVVSFCAHTIVGSEVLVVEDTHEDDRFRDDALVVGEPYIRFYAGAPLSTAAGVNIGTLALLDCRPRTFGEQEQLSLAELARVVVDEVELRLDARLAAGNQPAGEELDPRLRLMSENLPVVVWTTDDELRFVTAVGPLVETFGFDPRQVVGTPLDELLGDGEAEDQAVPAHRRALAGEAVTYQTEFAGGVFYAHVAPLRDAGGAVVGVIGVALDVTARVRAERERDAARERLTHSERLVALGTLAASIGHEISNPLTYILANIRIVATELERLARRDAASHPSGDGLEEIRSALGDIQIGAERVHHIVRDLRLFARTEPEKPGRTESAAAVIESALRLAALDVRLAAELRTDLGPVRTIAIHETRLAQICLNLVINAAHAIPPGMRGHIGVVLRDQGDMVELTVSDDGCGIPDHLVPRIFDPFFTTKSETLGSGLGLSIVRDIVATAGGTIEVDSQMGRGTTFTIRLPQQ